MYSDPLNFESTSGIPGILCDVVVILLVQLLRREDKVESMVRYTAELSKSNRSACKRCKEKIEKDVIRIGAHVTTADDITMVLHCKSIAFHQNSHYDTANELR